MSNPIEGQVERLSNYSGPLDAPTGGFRDDTGTLVDPATIVLTLTAPDGTQSTYAANALTRDGTGLYHYDLDTTDGAGDWRWEWSSTDPQAYQPGSFHVDEKPSGSASDIATIRLRTSGCTWMTDSDLTEMLGVILKTDSAGIRPGDAGYTTTPDLWAISAMVLEQYQINNLLNQNTNANQIKGGDAAITYAGSNTMAMDQVIRRYWFRADPVNRAQFFQPRIRSFQIMPQHRPQLLRRWMGVYPVLNGYPGADVGAGDGSLETQMFQDFAPLMVQENDL